MIKESSLFEGSYNRSINLEDPTPNSKPNQPKKDGSKFSEEMSYPRQGSTTEYIGVERSQKSLGGVNQHEEKSHSGGLGSVKPKSDNYDHILQECMNMEGSGLSEDIDFNQLGNDLYKNMIQVGAADSAAHPDEVPIPCKPQS